MEVRVGDGDYAFRRRSPGGPGTGAVFRYRHHQRPHHRWHGLALVYGRYRNSQRKDCRHWKSQRRSTRSHHRCTPHGCCSRFHRHARTVGVHHPCRPPPAVEDFPRDHHGNHRRGRIHRPAERRHSPRRSGAIRSLPHSGRLADVPRILLPAREATHRNQPCQLRRRHARQADGARRQ